ncbi:hypothetical protein CEXT_87601 [Caerostris extrusa]|uniref:Uncharacterized protein n=1 Tax=Caerostris extrusa TaxID=172846 RepID=A0AAV4Y4P5_CAEEX|nr:hypothetical protein CEXT_87601 [Caerostris extrusa]
MKNKIHCGLIYITINRALSSMNAAIVISKTEVGKREREWEKDRELHHVSDVTASPRRIVLTEIRQDNPPSTGSAGTGPMAAGS